MDSTIAPEGRWCVAGEYRKRPILNFDETATTGAPILLYDAHSSPADGSRVPRFIARKITIPPPSQEQMKVISLAPPLQLPDEGDCPTFDINCKEADVSPSQNSRCRHSMDKDHLILVTTMPCPPQLAFLLPFLIILGDIGVLIASFLVKKTSTELIAGCCVLVLVPDVASLCLLLKKGVYSTSIALHLLLWSSVILMFLQPFTSTLFTIHVVMNTLMILFVFKLRGSFHNTFCLLQ